MGLLWKLHVGLEVITCQHTFRKWPCTGQTPQLGSRGFLFVHIWVYWTVALHGTPNTASTILCPFCFYRTHIIVQLKNAVNADCLWVMVNKNLPLARFSKCAVCLAVETFLIHLNYKTRQYIGLTCKLAKCLNVEGKVGETQFNGYPTVLCVV